MDIRKKAPGDEFRKCDNCTYDRGFHSSLIKSEDKYKVILICPECGTRYDVGWKIEL